MTHRHPPTLRRGIVMTLGLMSWLADPGRPLAQTPEARGMTVSVVAARRHCFHDRLSVSGTFSPRNPIEVRADRDGLMVSEVFVEEGDGVTTDQVLARLTAPPGAPQEGVALKAPAKGAVVAVAAAVGSYASPSAKDPMFRIVGDAGLELKAEILASRMSRLKAGMPARVHVVGLGDLDGTVAAVGTAIDPMTQFGTVSLTVPDPRLRGGAFARAEIDAGQDCGFLIPLSALLSGPEGEVVAVVHGDRVEMRAVKIGILEAGDAEVRDGLSENEQVIARAGAFLREGDRVRAVPAAALDAGNR